MPLPFPRALGSLDGLSIEKVRELCRNLVIERLKKIALYRLTLDFDGFRLMDFKPNHGRNGRGL